MPPQVLIIGVGPTGFMLALWLTRSHVKVRLIDKAPEPSITSRALVTHARTLEFCRQLGIAEEAIARGIKFAAATLVVDVATDDADRGFIASALS